MIDRPSKRSLSGGDSALQASLVIEITNCEYSRRFFRRFVMAVGGKERISKAEALGFLLTHIVVERQTPLELDQLSLFQLNSIAQRAVDEISDAEGIIPHEVIERLAAEYLDKND